MDASINSNCTNTTHIQMKNVLAERPFYLQNIAALIIGIILGGKYEN